MSFNFNGKKAQALLLLITILTGALFSGCKKKENADQEVMDLLTLGGIGFAAARNAPTSAAPGNRTRELPGIT